MSSTSSSGALWWLAMNCSMSTPCRATACARVARLSRRSERGRTRQRIDPADGRLHQQVRAQHIVIVEVFVAAAQAVDALRKQVAKTVLDARRIAWIAEYRCGCSAQ